MPLPLSLIETLLVAAVLLGALLLKRMLFRVGLHIAGKLIILSE